MKCAAFVVLLFVCVSAAQAATYEVGPGKDYANIGDVPWESLQPGDTVLIHWRSTPYREKWVICRQGTAASPIEVRGVPDAGGELPVIEGDGATTPAALNFWSEGRGVIKVGGANSPPDTMPAYITVEGLEVRSARPGYTYIGDDSGTHTYPSNAAAIYVEKGQNITIRNCVLHDCGNGLFASWETSDLLVEGCHIYGNGIEGSIYEHNNYTEASGITFQYNHFGPLRANCLGNNLKDRSGGCVIRYNWIESGNRQLDLVDSDHASIYNDSEYRKTLVYGNILIEPDGAGNRQILHYGGDSGSTGRYRKGTLYFYNNTVISTRNGRTTLMRLSTSDEHADCRNNIIYVTDPGNELSLLDEDGTLDLRNNWIKPGWANSFSGPADVNDLGGNVEGTSPGFVDEAGRDYHLAAGSGCIDSGAALPGAVLPDHDLTRQYVEHQESEPRPVDGTLDIGAYEWSSGTTPGAPFVSFASPLDGATVSGTIVVNAFACDTDVGSGDGEGIEQVVFELKKGAPVVDTHTDLTVTYDWSLDTTAYVDGEYALRATATSTAAAGGTSTTVSITIIVANLTAPASDGGSTSGCYCAMDGAPATLNEMLGCFLPAILIAFMWLALRRFCRNPVRL